MAATDPQHPIGSPAYGAIFAGAAGFLVACILRVSVSKFDSGLYGMALIDITWFVAYAAIVVGGVGVNALVRELLRRDVRCCQQCGYNLVARSRPASPAAPNAAVRSPLAPRPSRKIRPRDRLSPPVARSSPRPRGIDGAAERWGEEEEPQEEIAGFDWHPCELEPIHAVLRHEADFEEHAARRD